MSRRAVSSSMSLGRCSRVLPSSSVALAGPSTTSRSYRAIPGTAGVRGLHGSAATSQATAVDAGYIPGRAPSPPSPSFAAEAPAPAASTRRKLWRKSEIQAIYDTPLLDLMFRAATVHRENHDPSKVQLCTLLNIKTGGCTEDCSYCSQSSKNPTGLKATKLMDIEPVLVEARKAKENGSTRFCMGAAWRDMNGRKTNFKNILKMVKEINGMGMEVCTTLGMLDAEQAKLLKEAGLTAYNHNLDTSREFYPKVITTRKYDERLNTIKNVRQAGLKVCSGGIIGLGESSEDRVGLIWEMSQLPEAPESFPVNALVPIEGTPLEGNSLTTIQTMLRTISTARIVMPNTIIRLAAGRISYTESEQAMCFMAGANAIFTGERMLTTPTNGWDEDVSMLDRWGLKGMKNSSEHAKVQSSSASLADGVNPEEGLEQKEGGQGGTEETEKQQEKNQDKLEDEMKQANKINDPVEKSESQPQVWS